MASSVTDKTDLQKDIESDAGVIPIFPHSITNREGQNIRATKDKMVPNTYARRLLEGKSEQHQEGRIRLCDSGFGANGLCPYNSQFWRSNESDRTLVPSGWITYNNDGGYTMCPLCRSHDLDDFDTIDEEMRRELERQRDGVDASTGHSGSTSSGNNKSLPPYTYFAQPRNTSKRKRALPISSKELLKRASGLFKGKIAPDRLKQLEKEIKKEDRDKRAKAAESRKRRKTSGGKRRKKRTRRRKSRGKSRRRMRGKRKGKSRRKRKR